MKNTPVPSHCTGCFVHIPMKRLLTIPTKPASRTPIFTHQQKYRARWQSPIQRTGEPFESAPENWGIYQLLQLLIGEVVIDQWFRDTHGYPSFNSLFLDKAIENLFAGIPGFD